MLDMRKFLSLLIPKKRSLIDAKGKKVYNQNKRRRCTVETHGKLYCKQCRGWIGCTPLLFLTIYSYQNYAYLDVGS